MSNTQKFNTEKMPIHIEGKRELVPLRQYLSHRTTELAHKHGTQIKKSELEAILEAVAAGKALDESNEQVWHDVYADVLNDCEFGTEESKRLREEEERKKEEEKEKNEAIALQMKSVAIAAAGKTPAEVFAMLSDKFDLGDMDRCVPKEGTTAEESMAALAVTMKMGEFSNWSRGDLILALEKSGYEKAMVSLCDSTGIPYKTLYKMAVTCRAVPPEKRNKEVSFTTYAEIAGARLSQKDDENAVKIAALVDNVGVKQYEGEGKEKKATAETANRITTSQEARAAIQAAQGKTPPTPPDAMHVDLVKHTFITFDADGGAIKAVVGFPNSLYGENGIEGITIVHAKTARKAHGKRSDIKWTALDVHTEPVPVVEAKPEEKTATSVPAAAATKETPAAPAAPAAPAKKGAKKGK